MKISKDIKDRLIDALITAFVFAAALSWRDSLMSLAKEILPDNSSALWVDLSITLIITGIVIFLVYTLLKSSYAVDRAFRLDDDEKTTSDDRST